MIGNLKINEQLKRQYYEKGYWGNETLCDAWNAICATYGPRPYVRDDGGHALTYAQVEEGAVRLASWLAERGVRNGDVVTFQMPKWAEFAIVYVACLKIGAVMHPIAARSAVSDVLYNVNKAQSVAFVCPTTYKGIDFEERWEDLADQLPSVKATLFVDRESPVAKPAHTGLMQVLESCAPYEGTSPAASDDVACILTTSGTTGPAKMALLTHNGILFSERSYVSVLGLSPDDIMWMPSPLNHATGFFHGLISVALLGGSTVLQEDYTPETGLELINEQGCTWSHGATPFIYDLLALLDERQASLPSMRLYLCGGAPVHASMVEHASRYGILLCESYGSTESCPHAYVPYQKCLEWNGQWSGIPYEGIEIRAVDEDRRDVPAGVQGEEASRGPHMFVGYLGEPERTDAALDDEGWFYSGDLCIIDEQGRLRINGRKKEIIIRGGENLSAHEIDEHLAGCPGLGDHATIGMPDERFGERICTFAVPVGRPPTLKQVLAYLEKKQVPKRFWPERLEFVDEIPHTETGKVKRYELAKKLLDRMSAEEAL